MEKDQVGRTARFARGTGEQPIPIRAVVVGKPPHACTGVDLEAVAEPVLLVSSAGLVSALNTAAETLLGVDRHQLIGVPIDSLVRCRDAIGDTAQRPIEYIAAYRKACVVHRSGREIPVEVMLQPNPSNAATLVVVRELATHDAPARDEDVASITHDLKTPISVIAIEAAMLETRIAPPAGSDIDQSLKRIARNLVAVEPMLDDLLDLASIEAAALRIRRDRVEVTGLVAEVVDRTVSSSERARVRVTTRGPIVVTADGPRLERVVANLVHNALKYAPRGTPIDIDVAAVGEQVRVSVRDAGPGLAPDDATRVFERFRRARSARDTSGVGLGLYVSRKIIEAHGGRIAVDSVFGKGSCFFFEVPAR